MLDTPLTPSHSPPPRPCHDLQYLLGRSIDRQPPPVGHALDGAVKLGLERALFDLDGPELAQMSVTNCVSSSVKPPWISRAHKMDERDLGRVARGARTCSRRRTRRRAPRHRGRRRAGRRADLDRVAVALPEQLAVEAADLGVDPGRVAAPAAGRRSRRSRLRNRCRCGPRSGSCRTVRASRRGHVDASSGRMPRACGSIQ